MRSEGGLVLRWRRPGKPLVNCQAVYVVLRGSAIDFTVLTSQPPASQMVRQTTAAKQAANLFREPLI